MSKVRINSADGISSRDRSRLHYTTSDFNVIKPVLVEELLPGDSINLKISSLYRSHALKQFTLGSVNFVLRSFFVPSRLAWEHYDAFFSQKPIFNGTSSVIPTTVFNVTSREFLTSLINDHFQKSSSGEFDRTILKVTTKGNGFPYLGIWCDESVRDYHEVYDFLYDSTTAVHYYYRLNPIGRKVVDVLHCLGYRLDFNNYSINNNYNTSDTECVYTMSLLPIVAYLRLFRDWYCPSNYYSLFQKLDKFLHYEYDGSYSKYAMVSDLIDMLGYACYVWYSDDMFSLGQEFPYAPNSSNPQTSRNVQFIYGDTSDHLDTDQLDKESISTNKYLGSTASTTSNYAIITRTVNRLAQWLVRQNLLTKRFNDYLNAKFGVKSDAVRVDVVEYLGKNVNELNFYDIEGTGENNLAEVGQKGIGSNSDTIQYTADEPGFLMVVFECRPRIGYAQGVDPQILRYKFSHIFDPAFDGQYYTPVPSETIYAGPHMSWSGTPDNRVINNKSDYQNRILSYLPAYWDYKVAHDNLSGDFALPRMSKQLSVMHMFRNVDYNDVDTLLNNNIAFRYSGFNTLSNNFDRIFGDEYSLNDHFDCRFGFNLVIKGRPLSLSESWVVNDQGDERKGQYVDIHGNL